MVQQAFRVDKVSTSNIEFKSNSFISSIASDASLASNVHLVLPTSVGSSGQVLATDGSGNLSFVSQGVGGPADLVQDNVTSLTSTVDSFGVYANNTFGAGGSNVSVANVTSQEFSIDGSTNTFTLVNTTDNVNKLLVSYGGIAQKPSEYTVSNTSLTLSNNRPLVSGTTVEVRYLDFEFSGSVGSGGGGGVISGTSYSSTLYNNTAAGITTFNDVSTPALPSYTIGKIGVYVNGVKLSNNAFSASTGDSVVLDNATLLGDDVEIVNFGMSSASLNDLTDVDITTNAPSNGQALVYVNANSKWEPGTVASSYGNSDVDLHLNRSTASTDQVLSWGGSDYVWVDQSAGGSSGSSTPALTEYEFITTANQTSFAATYIPGSIQLFLNGVKLANTEFTATTGSSIVLGANTAPGDIVSISKIGGSSNLTVSNASASSTGSISYDNGSEVLTYTPPDLSGYQSTLVSNTNIKTINGDSILGSGDITISAGGGIAGTLGSLTKSFANNESSTITLSSNVSPVPNVSVFKEIAQAGFSSKGSWDVNANATNYDFYDEKPISYASSTLTPSATGDGTFTSSNPTVVGYQMSSTVNLNSTSPSITAQGSGGSWQVVEFDPTGNHVYMVSNTTQVGYAKTVYQYTMSTPHDLSTLNTTPANTLDMSSRVSGTIAHYCPLHITNSGYDLYFGDYQNNIIYQWKMSTAYDLSTASYHGASSAIFVNTMASLFIQPNGLTGYQVQDGITGSAVLREFTMSVAWDITTASLSGTTSSTLISRTQAVTISPDGTLVIASDAFGSTTSKYFTMSPGYDLSSLSSGTSFTWQGNSSHTTDTRFSSNGALLYGWTGTYIYNYTTGSTAAFSAADVGKKVVGNSGSAIITATSGTYKSVTPFADTSAISSWQLFGAQGKADGSGIELSGYSVAADIVFPTGASGAGASMVYNNNVSPTSSVYDDVRSVVFNSEGTIALVLKAGKVLRFNLSTAFDLSTMTEASSDNFTAQLTSNQFGIRVKPDGTRIWVSDYGNDLIKQFTLSTPWSPSTQSYDGYYSCNNGGNWNSFSGADGVPSTTNFNPFSFQFNSDGTKMITIMWDNSPYHSVVEFALSTGWDMSTMSYTSFANFDGNSDPEAIAISPDGLKLMMHGSGLGDGGIEVYSLPSAFSVGNSGNSLTKTSGTMDLSTLTGNSSNNITYGGLSMSSDGKRMWVIYNNNSGANPIYEITGGTTSVHPYSTYSPALTNSSTGQINSSSWQDINSMTADETKNDGDVFYAVSTDNRTSWGVAKGSDGVRKIAKNNSGTWQYNNDAGTGGPVSSVADAVYESQFSIPVGNKLRDILFNSDGTKMYILLFSPDVRQYSLSVAYDISTAVYDVISLTTSSEETLQTGMKWNNDGTKLYIIGYSNDKVHEYVLTTAYDLSTASYNNVFFSVSSQMATPFGLTFKPDGTKMYATDNAGNIYQYTLSTAWDLSSAAYDNISFSVSHLAEGLIFNSLGTKLHYVNSNTLRRWNLSTAWDISTLTFESSLDFDSDIPSNGLATGLAFNNDESRIYITWRNADGIATYNLSVLGYGTSETWVNGTNNNEHATLQEALTSQAFNRMDKAQLDAVADGYHFSQDSADTLDLMIAPYAASGTSPVSDGVTINYDAEALVKQAINGTDYEAYFPSSNSVSITSLAAQNLKIRII